MYETDVPAQCAQTRQETRFPQANVDEGGPGDHPGPASQRTPPALGLTSAGGSSARPRPGRIRSRRIFAELRRSPDRGRCGPLSASFVRLPGGERPLVGYAVGRRVGNAVVRNRLRRRMRAVLQELAAGLPPGAYLVTAGSGATSLSAAELRGALEEALRRAVGRALTGTAPPAAGRASTKDQVSGRWLT